MNETERRQWNPNIDTATDRYPFSVRLAGYIVIPAGIKSLKLIESGGNARMYFDGKNIAGNSFESPPPGIYAITVEYARNEKTKPSLKLLWLTSDGEKPIPPNAFSKNAQLNTNLAAILGWAALILWFVGLMLALKQTRPRIEFNTLSTAWLVFILLMVYFSLDLQHDGRNFGFQIFQVGNDWLSYESLARAIALGDWLSTQEGAFIFLNFGYRYILSFMHWLTGEAPANAMLLQRCIMACSVVFAFYATQRLYGRRTALTLVVIVVACKHFLEFAQPLLDTTFGIAFSFAMIYCLIRYSRDKTRVWIISAGVLLGISILIRSNFLLFVFLAPLWFFTFAAGNDRLRTRMDISIFTIIALVFLGVIGVRNYLNTEQWVFLPTSGMSNLWIGNHPPQYDGPTYFTARQPPPAEVFGRVIAYSLSDFPALSMRIQKKALYLIGVDRKNDFQLAVALPWLIAVVGSVKLWRIRSMRAEVALLWLWIFTVNVPLVILFPWGYGWRLSAPSYLPLYLLCALAIAAWTQLILQNRQCQIFNE